ncbi:Aste57867_16668 [Aphanomyces stellatus]|uniref:Aste57867_16668 protein n=1 Tax=Aphanomyces stellatus TaxID=120398 RepID=A0A485L6U0_9STRA|nr:hypothetical protein As57867_016611 [Aphanomyces stellatus]VFT93439.1 Aste57867_16668 [Aphanomyces stellatus]
MCVPLPNSTAYQAVGDISKLNDTNVSIESRGRERMDLSKTILSNKTTSITFDHIANFDLPSMFSWPFLLTKIEFMYMINFTSSVRWPSTLTDLTIKEITNFTLPASLPWNLSTLILESAKMQSWPIKLPGALNSLLLLNCIACPPVLNMNVFAPTIRSLYATNSPPCIDPYEYRVLDITDVTEIVLGAVTDLTLRANDKLTRLTMSEAPLKRVDLKYDHQILDHTYTFKALQKIATPSSFINTNITVDAFECIHNAGSIKQLFEKDTAGAGNHVYTVCVKSQGFSLAAIAGFVSGGVVVVGGDATLNTNAVTAMKVEASDVKVKASAAPKSEPSMAPPFTAKGSGPEAKVPVEAESITGNARVCIMCFDGPQDAACVSCGHNALSMNCAKHLLKQKERPCPVCRQRIRQVLRIYRG